MRSFAAPRFQPISPAAPHRHPALTRERRFALPAARLNHLLSPKKTGRSKATCRPCPEFCNTLLPRIHCLPASRSRASHITTKTTCVLIPFRGFIAFRPSPNIGWALHLILPERPTNANLYNVSPVFSPNLRCLAPTADPPPKTPLRKACSATVAQAVFEMYARFFGRRVCAARRTTPPIYARLSTTLAPRSAALTPCAR